MRPSRVCVCGLVGLLAALVLAQQPPGVNVSAEAIPTGDRATSPLLLERISPAEVRLGSEITYQLRLTNASRRELRMVELYEQFPPSFTVRGVAPQTSVNDNRAGWRIDRLPPGAVETFTIKGTSARLEELRFCANVRFQGDACGAIKLVEPKLAVALTATPAVVQCDPIALRIVVSNPGSGVARAVKLNQTLSSGLATTDGKTAFMIDVGDLNPGQSKEYSVQVRAARTGEYPHQVTATEAGGLTASADARSVVTVPVLRVACNAPQFRFLGRSATFEYTVRNEGNAPATDAVLTATIPPNAEYVPTDGAQPTSGTVTFRLGNLQPGEGKKVTFNVNARTVGALASSATVKAYCAEAATSCNTEIRGIPAILLEVVDLEDPDEVGTSMTYVIDVLNQGSAVGTNIRIVTEVQPEADFVSADGPTRAAVAGKTVTFDPLPTLAPRARAQFKVVVKGMRPGDTRFKVQLTSDQIESPVNETEATRFYE